VVNAFIGVLSKSSRERNRRTIAGDAALMHGTPEDRQEGELRPQPFAFHQV
jgi:hypothetical protein